MQIITNSLIWVMNHQTLSNEFVDRLISHQSGISRVKHSNKSNGLIFIDYDSDESNMVDITHNLQREGINARIIGI